MSEKKETVLEKVQNQISELIEKKESDLLTIEEKIAEASAKAAEAERDIKAASAEMDVTAYRRAKDTYTLLQNTIEMYSEKRRQINEQEYMSEKESDSVIDSLVEYERGLAADFSAAVAEHLIEIRNILEIYRNEVAATESTITTWCSQIHHNYRTIGTSYGETGRAKRPVPVHLTPYRGCSLSDTVEDFLNSDNEVKRLST